MTIGQITEQYLSENALDSIGWTDLGFLDDILALCQNEGKMINGHRINGAHVRILNALEKDKMERFHKEYEQCNWGIRGSQICRRFYLI